MAVVKIQQDLINVKKILQDQYVMIRDKMSYLTQPHRWWDVLHARVWYMGLNQRLLHWYLLLLP